MRVVGMYGIYFFKIRPDAENRTIVSLFVWTQYRNVTEWRRDRQTVRKTDGIPLAITALCIASTADALYSRQRPVGDRDSGEGGEVGGGWTSAVKSGVVGVSTFILLGESQWKCNLEEMTQW